MANLIPHSIAARAGETRGQGRAQRAHAVRLHLLRAQGHRGLQAVRSEPHAERSFSPFRFNYGLRSCSDKKKTNTGTIKCRVCEASYTAVINCTLSALLLTPALAFTRFARARSTCSLACGDADLSEPIDVFSEWVDETEKSNAANEGAQRRLVPPTACVP